MKGDLDDTKQEIKEIFDEYNIKDSNDIRFLITACKNELLLKIYNLL